MSKMMIGDLFKHFDNKIPCLRHIDVIRNGDSKKPIGENNSLTPGQIMINRGNKNLNSFSFHIKHIKDLFCIDFDTKKLNHCNLYNYLNNNNVGFVETVKGFHYYIYIKNIGDFTNEIKILNQDIDMDLIGKGRNVWETKDREYNGDINNIKSFEWSDVKQFFNIQKMNFNNTVQEGEPIEIAKCSKEELIKLIDSTKIIDRISNYDDWLTLGMICYNNFDGSNEGLEIFNKYSKEDDKYEGKKTIIEKYNTFNDTRSRLMSYKRLIKWNAIDYPCKNEYERHYKTGTLIEYMNEKHAFFLPMGGEYFTFRENDEILRQKKQAFVDYLIKYNFKIIDKDGKEKEIEPVKIWLKNQDRRDIERVVFKPNCETKNEEHNLWTGFKYKNTGPCDLSKVQHILDHLLNIWADCNKEVYDWLIGWFARMFQCPENKNAICLALYSFANGVGKNIILDLIRDIMSDKYFLSTSKDEQILGRFNSDVEGKILVNMNETSILYDKKLSGPFKEFITEKTISIERKGLTAYTIDNYANCIMTTNESHIVSITGQDRRFNIIQCSDKKHNSEYYKKIADTDLQELANFFYNVDISNYDPRDFPRTELFNEQIELSFDNIQAFVHKLIEGEECTYNPWYDEDADDITWLNKKQFYDDYVKTCVGYKSPQSDVHLFRTLNKIFGKNNIEKRRGEFRLPPLDIAKQMWAKYNGFTDTR